MLPIIWLPNTFDIGTLKRSNFYIKTKYFNISVLTDTELLDLFNGTISYNVCGKPLRFEVKIYSVKWVGNIITSKWIQLIVINTYLEQFINIRIDNMKIHGTYRNIWKTSDFCRPYLFIGFS